MPADQPEPQGSFVTTQQAARLLGVSVRTVQLWVESGVLQAWKTAGGHRRIPRAAVEGLRDQQREVIQTVTGLTLLRVLVVERDPTRAELYALKIESWRLPAMVSVVGDGFEALLEMNRFKPNVLITDLRLDGMSGLNFTRALARQAPDLLVIATGVEPSVLAAGGLPKQVTIAGEPLQWDLLESLLQQRARSLRVA